MQLFIELPDNFSQLPKKQKQEIALKAITAKQQATTDEWRRQWKQALQGIKGMWKDRDISEFETIRQECNHRMK